MEHWQQLPLFPELEPPKPWVQLPLFPELEPEIVVPQPEVKE